MESFTRHENDMEVNIITSAKTTCVCSLSRKPFFLYGCEAWSLIVQMERKIYAVYTRMRRMVINVSWEDHTENVDLYGTLPRVTNKIRAKRMDLAGHCVRHHKLVASSLIL